jgi:hypothetical protein
LVRHRDWSSKRPRSEWRDGHVPHQLLEPEWRRGQHVRQDAIETRYLGIQFSSAGRSVRFPTLLIGAQRLPLILGLSSERSPLRPCHLLLFDTPCPLLRLALALLTPLRFSPGSQDTTLLSRHRSSPAGTLR